MIKVRITLFTSSFGIMKHDGMALCKAEHDVRARAAEESQTHAEYRAGLLESWASAKAKMKGGELEFEVVPALDVCDLVWARLHEFALENGCMRARELFNVLDKVRKSPSFSHTHMYTVLRATFYIIFVIPHQLFTALSFWPT